MDTMSQVTGDHAAVELNSRERQVVALRDRFPAATPDTDWITALSQEDDWTVVTHDRLNKGAEREVLKRAAIKVFLLDKSWKNKAFWAKAENLVRWWPSIVDAGRAHSRWSDVSCALEVQLQRSVRPDHAFKQCTSLNLVS